MSKENKENKMEKLPQTPILMAPEGVDPKEILKRLVYKPSALVWKNFQVEQPSPDRWVIIWCNLGRIAPNFLLTYRDAMGNYDLPHPTKAYPVQAWAYIDLPCVDETHMEQIQKELDDLAKKPKESIPDAKPQC